MVARGFEIRIETSASKKSSAILGLGWTACLISSSEGYGVLLVFIVDYREKVELFDNAK